MTNWYAVALIGVMLLAALLYVTGLNQMRCPVCRRRAWVVYGGTKTATFECKHCHLWHTCRHSGGKCKTRPQPKRENEL